MYFLNIYKPKGISSFDVIKYLRKRLKIKQIGHSGTLDPLACGVMQVAVGEATRLLDLLNSDKIYIAEMKLGYASSTYDSEGEKTFISNANISEEELKQTLKLFSGKIMQTPPKYSAVKINGKRACDLARYNSNAKIDIKPREIEIYSIKLLKFKKDTAIIYVSCKKGTYIRSLVNDIGEKLGCGAYMSRLTRIKAGNFELKNSNKLDNEKYKKINPLDCLDIKTLKINAQQLHLIKNGNFIKLTDTKFKDDEFILLTNNNKVVSLCKISDNLIKPKKNFKDE